MKTYYELSGEWAELDLIHSRLRYRRLLLGGTSVLLAAAVIVWILHGWLVVGDLRPLLIVVVFLLAVGLAAFIPMSTVRRQSATDVPPILVSSPNPDVAASIGQPEQYGPNGDLVTEFLNRLPALSSAHWHLVIARHRQEGRSGWAAGRHLRRAHDAWSRLGRHEALDAESTKGAAALRHTLERLCADGIIPTEQPYTAWEATALTCDVLYFRHYFSSDEFEVLYYVFEPVIPAASLPGVHRSG
jgi:hypothetical protein